ncbi:MAG: hypothetical protein NVS1B11_34430 [Terriglobales bacterium]
MNGGLIPDTLKPAPLAVTCDTVTPDVPEFVMLSKTVALAPTATLPNAKLEGFAVNCPEVDGIELLAFPDKASVVTVAFPEAEVLLPDAGWLAKAALPDWLPELWGVKVTSKVADCPGFNVIGKLLPLTWKAAPEVET